MENAKEALMMAFGVFTLIIALSISISLLGQVNACSDSILNNIDRENSYLYVENKGSERTVGVETIIPAIYRAYEDNYVIKFYNSDKTYGYPIYTRDSEGICEIDFGKENWKDDEFFKNLIFGKNTDEKYNGSTYKFLDKGLYNELKDKIITEYLGEYSDSESEKTEESNVPDTNKTKTRVIVYVIGN